ncbi:hypothetical protein L2E82_22712 [Cichorium intybus]|uniref:Uncharacterized protein n=1 Tax=Cichorium intybus TaxID=13427 RepID=A0ACB9DYR1_CICIN|nr:hypothetical protein L2E82_22712 [Cichorium intybus]
MTTFNSVVKTILERNGLHSHVPCIPGIPWSYNPWNSAIPVSAVCPAGYFIMSFYPSSYWNYIPWLPQTDSSILGKHPREGKLMIPNGYEEPKKHRILQANPAHKVIEKSIGMFVAERKAAILRDKGVSLKANVVVTKMIDKGVTSFQKLCSFCMP